MVLNTSFSKQPSDFLDFKSFWTFEDDSAFRIQFELMMLV